MLNNVSNTDAYLIYTMYILRNQMPNTSRAIARSGTRPLLGGVQWAPALCRSASLFPSSHPLPFVRECRGRQPFAGARGVLALSFLPAAAGGKKGVYNSPGQLIWVSN